MHFNFNHTFASIIIINYYFSELFSVFLIIIFQPAFGKRLALVVDSYGIKFDCGIESASDQLVIM